MNAKIALLLGAIAVAGTVQAAVSLSNKEIWFGPNTNNPGSGTLTDPYNVAQFQYIMSGMCTGNVDWAVSTNATVHLLPATYSIRWNTGSFATLSMGLHLIGSNATNTFVQLSGATNSSGAFYVLASVTDNSSLHVSDLTIDCNYGAGGITAQSVGGLSVSAAAGTVERVRIANFGATNTDVYGIYYAATSAGSGTYTIQDCRIDGPVKGSNVNAQGIIIFGNGSNQSVQRTNVNVIIRNNHISNIGSGWGIDVGPAANNVLVEGNAVNGVSKGITADFGTVNNLQIANNIIQNIGLGISVGQSSGSLTNVDDGVMIANNLIEVNGSVPQLAGYSYYQGGILISGGVRNGTIKNNLVQVTPAARGTNNPSWYALRVASWNSSVPNTNIVITGNSLASTLAVGVTPAEVSYMTGNHSIEGYNTTAYEPFLSSVQQMADAASSLTLSSVPSAHQWVQTMWVACNTTSAATGGAKVVHVPDPYYYQGRTFTLFLYTSNTTNPISLAIQADSNGWGGSYVSHTIMEPKTGTYVAAGSPFTVNASSTSGVTLPVRLTAVGGGWQLEK